MCIHVHRFDDEGRHARAYMSVLVHNAGPFSNYTAMGRRVKREAKERQCQSFKTCTYT